MGVLQNEIRRRSCGHSDWYWDYAEIPTTNHPSVFIPTSYPYYDEENDCFVIAEWLKVKKCDDCGEWLEQKIWKRETVKTDTIVVNE